MICIWRRSRRRVAHPRAVSRTGLKGGRGHGHDGRIDQVPRAFDPDPDVRSELLLEPGRIGIEFRSRDNERRYFRPAPPRRIVEILGYC
jgi:hypothetical protein